MEEILYLGKITFRNQEKKFGIKLDDRRKHIYIIGKTGMGKTVLLLNMAIQDILAGRGIGFIDPHGDAAELLLNYIPSKRINDVVYFNPADVDYPIAFNIMEEVLPQQRHIVCAAILGVFKKIWPDVWSARMEYILNNAILALLEYPNTTLLAINRILSDAEYRKKVLEKVEDPMVKSFWLREFARYTQSYEVEATAAIQNKVGQFISNPLIRNIIGQVKSKINIREIMDEGKILIANLSKGRIGEENSRLLGALLVTKLQLAAMERVDTPEEKRRDFFLYVDEFQNFATEAFATTLSEARKYRLSLILANQYLKQLEEATPTGKSRKIIDAIFGNVGTIILFRVGAEDAEFFAKEFGPECELEDLVNLPKFNIFVKLMVDGKPTPPFSAQTLPLFPPPPTSNAQKIISVSRERYAKKREEIEEKIKKWAEIETPPPPPPPVLFDAKCSLCGKKTKVPFLPDSVRPVYCKSCLKKLQKKEGEETEKKENENDSKIREVLKDILEKANKNEKSN